MSASVLARSRAAMYSSCSSTGTIVQGYRNMHQLHRLVKNLFFHNYLIMKRA